MVSTFKEPMNMSKLLSGFCFAALAICATACAKSALTLRDDPAYLIVKPSDPEARAWIKSNVRDPALPADRFRSNSEALDFVNSLYSSGAQKVVIASESISGAQGSLQAGTSADALRVILPTDGELRVAVVQTAFMQSGAVGFDAKHQSDERKMSSQSVLYLWWR
jgi:hypothetical protein